MCRYFDATLSNSKGEPVTIDKAICMHEEDHGLLYKHVDYRTGHSESRRMRRLVISHISTVVNYEYCFYWYLYQDGTISLDIKLTGARGCLSTGVAAQGCTQRLPFLARLRAEAAPRESQAAAASEWQLRATLPCVSRPFNAMLMVE